MVKKSVDRLVKENRKKLMKGFNVTSVCREDIVEVFEAFEDEEMLEKILNISDSDMIWIAGKLADQFCGCCFWGALENRVERVFEDKEKECTKKKKKQ